MGSRTVLARWIMAVMLCSATAAGERKTPLADLRAALIQTAIEPKMNTDGSESPQSDAVPVSGGGAEAKEEKSRSGGAVVFSEEDAGGEHGQRTVGDNENDDEIVVMPNKKENVDKNSDRPSILARALRAFQAIQTRPARLAEPAQSDGENNTHLGNPEEWDRKPVKQSLASVSDSVREFYEEIPPHGRAYGVQYRVQPQFFFIRTFFMAAAMLTFFAGRVRYGSSVPPPNLDPTDEDDKHLLNQKYKEGGVYWYQYGSYDSSTKGSSTKDNSIPTSNDASSFDQSVIDFSKPELQALRVSSIMPNAVPVRKDAMNGGPSSINSFSKGINAGKEKTSFDYSSASSVISTRIYLYMMMFVLWNTVMEVASWYRNPSSMNQQGDKQNALAESADPSQSSSSLSGSSSNSEYKSSGVDNTDTGETYAEVMRERKPFTYASYALSSHSSLRGIASGYFIPPETKPHRPMQEDGGEDREADEFAAYIREIAPETAMITTDEMKMRKYIGSSHPDSSMSGSSHYSSLSAGQVEFYHELSLTEKNHPYHGWVNPDQEARMPYQKFRADYSSSLRRNPDYDTFSKSSFPSGEFGTRWQKPVPKMDLSEGSEGPPQKQEYSGE